MRFLPHSMLLPLQKRKKPPDGPRPPLLLHLLFLVKPCPLTDEEMDGNQHRRKTTVRFSWIPFERFLPPLQGDGGAFPECHIAQYPLDMGRKKVCLHEYIPALPFHSFIGFLRKYTSPSSGRRG